MKAEGRIADAKAARRTVVKKCKALGDKDPTIWIQVLTSFAKEYSGSPDDEESIKDVLKHVDEESLLPPLLVIQVLCGVTCACVSRSLNAVPVVDRSSCCCVVQFMTFLSPSFE